MEHPTAPDLIAALRAEGFDVELAGDRLRVSHPDRALSDAERVAIRANRDALVARLADEAWETWDRLIAETVVNVLAASPAEKRGWHRQVIAALRWLEAGQPADDQWRADAGFDAEVVRRLLGPGRCLDCGKATAERGDRWCQGCAGKPYAPPEPTEEAA